MRVPAAMFGYVSAACVTLGLSACRKDADEVLVVYCSVDETFGRQVLDAFESEHGVRLDVLFDSEAGKTTGLVNKIRLERERPRADVFWSSELFNTIVLSREGLLARYDSPNAADIPERYRDREHRWTAFGLRGRVLAYDPKLTSPDSVPTSWQSLSNPEVTRDLAFANPLFGTTRGHVAAMFALWGPERGRAFLEGLRSGGVRVVDGNSAAVREVLEGRSRFAATDTDDVIVANRSGAELEMRYADMGDGGTLLIPNSVGIVSGARHETLARRLVDFLVSARVEEMLARSDSRNVPVRRSLREKLGVETPPETQLSYDAIADAMPEAVAASREILIR